MIYQKLFSPSITPNSILAGLGNLTRAELCGFLSLLETVDRVFLVKGAVEQAGAKFNLLNSVDAERIQTATDELVNSIMTDAVLRHRLWVQLADALAIPTLPPLSKRSASQSAAAMAVRASERLSPSIITKRKDAEWQKEPSELFESIGTKAADVWNAAKKLTKRQDPLRFPELVSEELLNLLADQDIIEKAKNHADPVMQEALRKGHAAALQALASGGSWAAFAAIVGNAGFLPYILAAKLSAWIPMVSGPALVSLLATLVNPVTLVVGVGTLGWVGMGRSSRLIRSQIAARLCVLLAVSGTYRNEEGFFAFLDDMRQLDRAPTSHLDHLSKTQRRTLRIHLSEMSKCLEGPMPSSAGTPPTPWNAKLEREGIQDAIATSALTAGEVLWHAAAIDPNVVAAADFSRSADLGDPFAFALSAKDFAIPGAHYSLRGYAAERLVMDQLIADGHDVRLAEQSNTPGLDLWVDGQPVQVKCGNELSNLSEHFEKHPNIPVIANESLAELAEGQVWAHMVTTFPGFDIDALEEQISGAIGHAASLVEPGVMEIAMSVGILRGGMEVAQGKVPFGDLPAWLILDGASRGVLGFAGGHAGAWIGLVSIGPAGAVVLGPVIAGAALTGNGNLKGATTRIMNHSWLKEALQLGDRLHIELRTAAHRRVDLLTDRVVRLERENAGNGISEWILARAKDDLIDAIEECSELRQKASTEHDCLELLIKAPILAPSDASVLRAANELQRHFSAKPGLNELLIDRPIGVVDYQYRNKLVPKIRNLMRRPDGTPNDET